jgi:hypothetical protein
LPGPAARVSAGRRTCDVDQIAERSGLDHRAPAAAAVRARTARRGGAD